MNAVSAAIMGWRGASGRENETASYYRAETGYRPGDGAVCVQI